jgi:hypothetical protein
MHTVEMESYTCNVPHDDLESLREISRKAHIAVAVLVRQAIRDYLESTKHDIVLWHTHDRTTRAT